jgi:hypothetical protein
MSKRIFTAQNQTYTPTATAATLANASYMGIQGGGSTQIVDILEVLISGYATTSTVAAMQLTPASTTPTTPTALASPNSDGPANASATALATTVTTYVAAGTGPQATASATAAKLNLGLNLFGGIIRWNAAPTQQITLVGNAANTGSYVLFNFATGGNSGPANAHIIYEPY